MNIQQNRKMWTACPWKEHGEEWSSAWGCTANLWQQTVFPRIHPLFRCAPDGDWLEIGCGHGRMTHYLLDEMHSRQQLIGVDLVTDCVAYCRHRFGEGNHARFETTNGGVLVAEDESIAFAFSWDSLVHCDRVVMDSYAAELYRILLPGGYAFLHHSNLGMYAAKMHDKYWGVKSENTSHLRDPSTSANVVHELCENHGLTVLLQELIAWGGDELIDCFTVVGKDVREQTGDHDVITNLNFMNEAHAARAMMEIEKNYVSVVGP